MKALLVDDHSLFRHGMELLLSTRLNFDHILHARNYEEALEQQASCPDLDIVILDYDIGKELGLDVLIQLKKNSPNLPVVMISGKDDPEIIFTSLGSGASGFFFKDIEPDHLVNAINHILEGGMYVPSSTVDTFIKQLKRPKGDVYGLQVQHMANVAKKIIYEKSLNVKPKDKREMTTALNHLLEELNEERSRLTALAFHDELTGLANRRLFYERLEQSIRGAKRNSSKLALIYIDLDHFKKINDTYGHQAGDDVLIQTADRLNQIVRETDTVARIGGDEFTIILTDIPQNEEVRVFVDRLHDSLRQTMQLSNGKIWQPTASIGVALSDGHESLDYVIDKADKALYQVKNHGRDSFAFNQQLSPPH